MDITTPLPDALQWSEGMLLSPQHFQQNDIYWHQQLWHRSASLQAHYWGVLDLAFVASALQGGVLKVERLQAILPDGLTVQFPDYRHETSLSLNLADPQIVWNEQQTLKIHLCVPMRSGGAASSNSSIRRFASLPGHPELDENTGDGRMAVGRLRPFLELLPENQVSAKHIHFPLAEIRRDSAKRYTLTDYHPPLLRSQASTFLDDKGLQTRLVQIAKKMRDKAKELVSDRFDEDGDSTPTLSPEVMQQLYAAKMLSIGLPPFEIQVGAWTTHPFELYQGLATLVGQVASIGVNPLPPVLPEYRHEDCLPGFRDAIAFIQQRLDKLQIDFESLYFDRTSSTAFTRTLPDDLLADTLLIEIKPAQGQNAEQVAQWLTQARIAGDELMPALAQRRLPGALSRAIDHSQLGGMQLKSDALIFEISNKAIEMENRLVPLFRRGGLLMIQGAAEMPVPAAIILHRTRIKSGRNSRKNESSTTETASDDALAGPPTRVAKNDPADILDDGGEAANV